MLPCPSPTLTHMILHLTNMGQINYPAVKLGLTSTLSMADVSACIYVLGERVSEGHQAQSSIYMLYVNTYGSGEVYGKESVARLINNILD